MRTFSRIRIKNDNPNLEILEQKVDFVLELDAELLKPENESIREDLRHTQDRIIDGELDLLTRESAYYWTATEDQC
jgi:hypothetical protein